jgi:threonine/homoserine/homoserine lactone efflux protein
MWFYVLQGIGYGFAAAAQPGPFQTYLISQSLSKGWKRTLPAMLAPFVSDGPIITLCLLLLSQVPDWFQQFLYIAGGLFILFLAYGAYKTWQKFDVHAPIAESASRQSILQAATVNALSPGPYIFWSLVTGPILMRGWRESPIHGVGFMLGFYSAMILCLATIILVFGVARELGPKVNRAMLGISAVALLVFGIRQLWLGILG